MLFKSLHRFTVGAEIKFSFKCSSYLFPKLISFLKRAEVYYVFCMHNFLWNALGQHILPYIVLLSKSKFYCINWGLSYWNCEVHSQLQDPYVTDVIHRSWCVRMYLYQGAVRGFSVHCVLHVRLIPWVGSEHSVSQSHRGWPACLQALSCRISLSSLLIHRTYSWR